MLMITAVESADGTRALIFWTETSRSVENHVSISGIQRKLPKTLYKPGVYDLKSFELIYPLSHDFNIYECLRSHDLTMIAEWVTSSWPPGLACYYNGTKTITLSGSDLFRRYSDKKLFVSTIHGGSLTDFNYDTDAARLDLLTLPRGPMILDLQFPLNYRDHISIDVKGGKLVSFYSSSNSGFLLVICISLLVLALCVARLRKRTKLGIVGFACYLGTCKVASQNACYLGTCKEGERMLPGNLSHYSDGWVRYGPGGRIK